MNYIQGHIRKFKGAGVNQILNHNFRESNFSRDVIHPDKAGNVIVQKIGDYSKIRGSVTGRKNSVDMLDLVVSVSDDSGIPIKEFHADLTAWAQKKYVGLVSVCTHGDERTLHSHISLVPLVKDKKSGKVRLSARDVLGNRSDLSRLQSELGQIGRKWGLVRGESATITKSEHETVGQRRAKLAKVPLERMPDEIPEKLGLLDGRKVAEQYRAKAAEAVETANRLMLRARDESETAAKLKKEKAAQSKELARLKAENERLREATAALRALDLVQVLQALGYEVDRVEGRETIFNTGQGHISINSDEHIFSCDWSKGGRGAIDLVMMVEQVDYSKAREILETVMGDGAAIRATVADVRSMPVKKLSIEEEIAVRATPMPDSSIARDYLVKRGIAAGLVDKLIESGRIWQNQFGGVCFPTSDANNNRTGCMIRSTSSPWKNTVGKISEGFKIRYGKDPNPLRIVCESPIDALSVATLAKGWNLTDSLVIHGLGGATTLPESLNNDQVISCFDADRAGKSGSKNCLYVPPRVVSRVLPNGAFVADSRQVKDYNELLSLGIEKVRLSWSYIVQCITNKLCRMPPPVLLTEDQAEKKTKPSFVDQALAGIENPYGYKSATEIRDGKKHDPVHRW